MTLHSVYEWDSGVFFLGSPFGVLPDDTIAFSGFGVLWAFFPFGKTRTITRFDEYTGHDQVMSYHVVS